ncbi:uncharacterized protein LOC105356839 [Oryzias latipes]|uniref:uncharacterized protein LOC105356839 n=1 Tax=Oryzias latipes TaxID=8090 RepID=UPI0009DA94AB|nr:uncharacterized protein LOC105356839 [Oryzias latipes]
MVIMFWRNTAVLLLIQMFQAQRVFAAAPLPEHRSMKVSRGVSVNLTCNVSLENPAEIKWTKDNLSFHHSFTLNATVSNFSSSKIRIETDLPTKLMILNVQDEDEGLYSCSLTDSKGFKEITWNLTNEVKEGEEDTTLKYKILFSALPAVALFLCCIVSTVCLWRKFGRSAEAQRPIQTELPMSGTTTDTDDWRNNRNRSEHMERLNSIYGCTKL